MARKIGKSGTKRKAQNLLNAYQIARKGEDVSDSSFEEDDKYQDGIMDARKFLGEDQGDLDLEDEELDSEDALGSDDEYDVLSSVFSQTIRDKKKKKILKDKDVGANSNDDISEDDGYTSLDENELVSLTDVWDMDEKDRQEFEGRNSLQLAEIRDVSEPESEESQSSESSDDEESDEKLELNESDDDDVNLSNTLNFVNEKVKEKQTRQSRRLINETVPENEYYIPTGGQKLSIKDMMSSAPELANGAILIDSEEEKSRALATPLPKRIKQRYDRKEAYELSKAEVSKWDDTVKTNRQAEVLKFPLNADVTQGDTSLTFKGEVEPSTELEKKVHDVLKNSALVDDKSEATFEEIAVAKFSPEEMKKRTNELRLMRELMFRDEKRAKRVKKIKSKQYHKIKKKEKIKNQQLVEGEDLEKDDQDSKRAQERMSLRHKTKNQWARSMIKSGMSKDATSRLEIEEMLRNSERLKSKQLGYEDGMSEDESINEIERDYQKDDEHEEDKLRERLGKGVLAMDFMKHSDRNVRLENLREIELLKNGKSIEDEDNSVGSNYGRRVYTPNDFASGNNGGDNDKSKSDKMVWDSEVTPEVVKSSTLRSTNVDTQTANAVNTVEDSSELSNPWLTTSDDVAHKASKVNKVDKSSSRLSKAASKINKSAKKLQSKDRNQSAIDVSDTFKVIDAYGSDDDDDDEKEVQFKQKDLIKEAFAGDNVVEEFLEEKKRLARDEDDKEEDATLPGWGDWVGSGKKDKKRKVVRKVNGVVQSDKRRDKNLKNVIINERLNKKNLKYQSSAVPFPYEHKEQFERTLRMPIGQEWASRESHQKLTMPRIVKKQGTVIDPLKAPFK